MVTNILFFIRFAVRKTVLLCSEGVLVSVIYGKEKQLPEALCPETNTFFSAFSAIWLFRMFGDDGFR